MSCIYCHIFNFDEVECFAALSVILCRCHRTCSSPSSGQSFSCSLSADGALAARNSWGTEEHPTALWLAFPQPQTGRHKCILSPAVPVLMEPGGGCRVDLWGLGGESGVDSHGRAGPTLTEEKALSVMSKRGAIHRIYRQRKETDGGRDDKVCQNTWKCICGCERFIAFSEKHFSLHYSVLL